MSTNEEFENVDATEKQQDTNNPGFFKSLQRQMVRDERVRRRKAFSVLKETIHDKIALNEGLQVLRGRSIKLM